MGCVEVSKCDDCGREMLKHRSCTKKYIVINNKKYLRVTMHFDKNKYCHDCGILNKDGNIHHLGCDVECCPKCNGQLLSCECRW